MRTADRRTPPVPWCHTCRVEYAVALHSCPECEGALTDAPAPERRGAAAGGPGLVVLATLPPQQALVASGRLDAGGIPNALRDVRSFRGPADPVAVEVLVIPSLVADARAVLRGGARRLRRASLGVYLFVVAAACVFLSGVMLAVRWLMTGSPLPG